MRKEISIFIIVLLTISTVQAQKTKECASTHANDKGTTLSIGAEFGSPSGDLSTGWNSGFGVSAKSAFPVSTDAAITASVGYMSFGGKSILGTSLPAWNMIPVKAGFRYNVSGSPFYIEPQVGYTFGSVSGASASNASGFTWAAGIGYFFTPSIDLGIRYESFKSANATSSANIIGLRLAYSFSLSAK
jgi:opacity protein-like surface antigen